jgi:hypothetical protein
LDLDWGPSLGIEFPRAWGRDGGSDALGDSALYPVSISRPGSYVLTSNIEGSLSSLRQDVIDGDIDRSHDLEALQVALSALLRGCRIFRKQYAKRIDTDADDLDERVAEIIRTWLEAMARPPAPKE